MKITTWIFAMGLCIIGCQRTSGPAQTGDEGTPTEVIQAENGSIYSIDCLRSNASRIASLGQAAMDSCRIEFSLLPETNSAIRGTYKTPRGPNYIVYYPPNYYSPNYQSNYQQNYRSNSGNNFCSYVFGSQWNSNCFSSFGYTPKYSSYYVPTCNSCSSGWSSSGCPNRCYYQGPVYSNSYSYIPYGGNYSGASYPYGLNTNGSQYYSY